MWRWFGKLPVIRHDVVDLDWARHPRIGLIVSLITGKEAIIGQAQYFARQAAQSLQQA